MRFNHADFMHPGPAYRIHPFWFWNGEMEDGVIEEQIGEMHAKGIGGFFLCARQGMSVPYLSGKWFEKVRLAVKIAETYGMQVWLYDEYPYPSGIAGGEVTLELPESKQYTLEHVTEQASASGHAVLELPWGRVLCAKAVPVDAAGKRAWGKAVDVRKQIGSLQAIPVYQKAGLTAYNTQRFFTYGPVKQLEWQAPDSDNPWEIHVFLEKEISDFKYYGTFVDPCNKEAVRAFVRLTHERYREELGAYFGGTIKGMFTDETGLLGRIPWSPQLPAYFRELNGYDIRDHLHALIDTQDGASARIRYDFFQTIHYLLRESYHKYNHDWCEANKLMYVTEVPSVRMSTQKFSHVPGGDSAHEKIGRSLAWILHQYSTNMRANPRMVSSLARQYGRDRALIECFHSVGWSMTLQDAKWMIDRMAALGINFYNFHAFFYTLDGLAKYDAPPSQFYQNPYWQNFRQLADYAGRISYAMSRGASAGEIAVLVPITTLWTHLGNPLHRFGYFGKDEAEKRRFNRLKGDWEAVCRTLDLNRKEYDHLDPEILAEADISGGAIRIGRANYRVLILPPLANLERSAWEKIKEFAAGGGTVISIGSLPYEAMEEGTPVAEEAAELFGMQTAESVSYWQDEGLPLQVKDQAVVRGGEKIHFIPSADASQMEWACRTLIRLLVEQDSGLAELQADAPADCFLMHQRRLDDGARLIFITNQEGGRHRVTLKIPAADEGAVRFYELDLEAGETIPVEAVSLEGEYRIELSFSPYASRLLMCAEPANEAARPPKQSAETPWVWDVPWDGDWTLYAERDNVMRLDAFDLTFGEEQQAYAVAPKTFIAQCADLAEKRHFPLQFSQIFGTPMQAAVSYPIMCKYQARFHVQELPERCLLLKDSGAISGDCRILVNGHLVAPETFKPSFHYDHRNEAADVSAMLKKGKNTVTVQVLVGRDSDGLLEPVYLLGKFGVFQDEASGCLVVDKVQESGKLDEGPSAGFPFYAGTIRFARNLPLPSLPSKLKFRLRFGEGDRRFHDVIEVRVNGQSLGIRAWTPYEWEGNSDMLRQGDNMVEVLVTNTLIGMLEGKTFNYEAHHLVPAAGPYAGYPEGEIG